MMKTKKEIPYSFYLWVQKKIADRCSPECVIKIKHAKGCLGEYRIPKQIRPIIIKEMEELELIKIERGGSLRVINFDPDILECTNKFYEARGFWTKLKY